MSAMMVKVVTALSRSTVAPTERRLSSVRKTDAFSVISAWSSERMSATLRRVAKLSTAHQQMEGGGFPVRRPFPSQDLAYADPFLLLDEIAAQAQRLGAAGLVRGVERVATWKWRVLIFRMRPVQARAPVAPHSSARRATSAPARSASPRASRWTRRVRCPPVLPRTRRWSAGREGNVSFGCPTFWT